MCSQFLFSQKTHTLTGNFVVKTPSDSKKLNIEIFDLVSQSVFVPQKRGDYILKSDKNKNYEIRFSLNKRQKFEGNIVVLNYRGADSIVVVQENSMFISSKEYRDKQLVREFNYMGDSIFVYKDYFSDAKYEGKARMGKHGLFNVENKVFDINGILKKYEYKKEGVQYEEKYSDGKLTKQKYIANNEKVIKYFEDGKFVRKDIYVYGHEECLVISLNSEEKEIERKPIQGKEFFKEFPEHLNFLIE